MPKLKLSKSETFSFVIVIILQFIAMATANLLIPQYGVIIEYFGIDKSMIGFADSIFVLVSAVVSIIWGYYTDRVDRNRVVMMGAFLWSIGTIMTAFNTIQNYDGFKILLISRGLTGAGMGCVIPIVLSIIGDLIPAEQRSSWFGTMAILSSISSGAGQGMASFLAPLTSWTWRFPFLVISIISIVIIILMFFIKIPGRGNREEELESLQDLEVDYMYQLTKKDILTILKKKTNALVFIQGFLSIIPGTLVVYFLTTLFSDSSIGLLRLLPSEIRVQVSTIMAAFVGIGYLVGNSVLADLGDRLFKKDKRNRVLMSAIALFISVPACIIFVFLAPEIDASFVASLPPNPTTIAVVWRILITYPQSFAYIFFAFIGSFFSAAPIANRGAVMVDVNLPEHRGTTNSFFSLAEQLGKGFTLALSFVMLTIFGSYKAMIIFAALFWLPAGLLWYFASKSVIKDMNEKSMILKERSQVSFLDYIFEMEILMDEGVQLIHDCGKFLESNREKSLECLDKAIKIFKQIETRGRRLTELGDLQKDAALKANRASILKNDLKNVIKLEKNQQQFQDELNQIRFKIEDQWEPSDIGKVERLYDSTILKVISAELHRKYNIFLTMKHLKESISTYDRVILLANERLIDEEARKLSLEEKEFQDRVKDLINKAEKSKNNTEYLLHRIQDIIENMKKEGVSQEDLEKVITLSSEYKVPFSEVLIESSDKRKSKKAIEKLTNEIDELFAAFDSNK